MTLAKSIDAALDDVSKAESVLAETERRMVNALYKSLLSSFSAHDVVDDAAQALCMEVAMGTVSDTLSAIQAGGASKGRPVPRRLLPEFLNANNGMMANQIVKASAGRAGETLARFAKQRNEVRMKNMAAANGMNMPTSSFVGAAAQRSRDAEMRPQEYIDAHEPKAMPIAPVPASVADAAFGNPGGAIEAPHDHLAEHIQRLKGHSKYPAKKGKR